MSDFGDTYCMDRALQNEQLQRPWYERTDTHCFHHEKDSKWCCWCDQSWPSQIEHGPHFEKPPLHQVVATVKPENNVGEWKKK